MPTSSAVVLTVNVSVPAPNPHGKGGSTGHFKRPATKPVEVRDPDEAGRPRGSGCEGDFIGDSANHGGPDQAVYAFAREELDHWERELGRELDNGTFGENLTLEGIAIDDARIGDVWQIGAARLQVTCPRIPCSTFRGVMGEKGWLQTFTAHGRPGAYLRVLEAGIITAGQSIGIVSRPDHDVTIAKAFRALTIERSLLPELLAAVGDLPPDMRDAAEQALTESKAESVGA